MLQPAEPGWFNNCIQVFEKALHVEMLNKTKTKCYLIAINSKNAATM